ncbi:MAG: type I-E CRISPR-associated protein Cse2/CasB [Hyphomicrobiaceae bacterium]
MSKSPYEDQAKRAKDWLAALRPRQIDGRILPGDRAALARLKRASSVMEAAAEPATAHLFEMLFSAQLKEAKSRDGFIQVHLPRAAVIAAVLAHVGDPRPETMARAIGTPRSGGDGSTPLVTPLRLKRLLAARDPDDVLIQFRRTVAILGHQANVTDLAQQLLAWTDDERGDLTRTRFAFDYHGAEAYAPDASAATV